jgi:hypothetical protein
MLFSQPTSTPDPRFSADAFVNRSSFIDRCPRAFPNEPSTAFHRRAFVTITVQDSEHFRRFGAADAAPRAFVTFPVIAPIQIPQRYLSPESDI